MKKILLLVIGLSFIHFGNAQNCPGPTNLNGNKMKEQSVLFIYFSDLKVGK